MAPAKKRKMKIAGWLNPSIESINYDRNLHYYSFVSSTSYKRKRKLVFGKGGGAMSSASSAWEDWLLLLYNVCLKSSTNS